MRVTAMLAYFDEPRELLEQAVDSVAVIADRVVAVDGGYELTPGAKKRSPKEQADTIRRSAWDAGLDVLVYEPARLWKGQVAKRHMMLRLAAQESDWVMPLDADWVCFGNREQVREELQRTNAEALEVQFATPANPDKSVKETAVEAWHESTAGKSLWYALLYRVLPDMSMDLSHWGYSALRPGNSDRIAYWDQRLKGTVKARTVRLSSDFLVEHWTHFRDERTRLRNREFCRERDKQVRRTGAEA
jgi:hypothetical protein